MEEEAPGFLGNLSKSPDGIYGTTRQKDEFVHASMIIIIIIIIIMNVYFIKIENHINRL